MKSNKNVTSNEDTSAPDMTKSNLWFYPGEELARGQMRITLMGTGWGNIVTPAQKGPSIFVELGNKANDSFVFDVGPGCILNYNAMNVPMSRMNKIFLSHLHMDHCSDLPFIYSFGPNLGDRHVPLEIFGPSGPPLLDLKGEPTTTLLGTKNLVEGMLQFTQWHTTSFATMTSGTEKSYDMKNQVKEFDFNVCGGIAHQIGEPGIDTDHVQIKHFPAAHIIDGAVSYRLEWSPIGTAEYLVFVYSGDTLPTDFMLEYGNNADILIHETAPSIDSIMNGAGSTEEEAYAIVCNSHTPANSLGSIIAKTKPRLAVTTHSPMDPRSVEDMILGVHGGMDRSNAIEKKLNPDETNEDTTPPYQIGADLMVFNLGFDENYKRTPITTRMSALIERSWPVRISEAPTSTPTLAHLAPNYQSADTIKPPTEKLDGNIFKKVINSEQCIAYNMKSDEPKQGE